ncbi:MAG: phosphatase PAP2 family protein [Syntrophales bacterium]
MEIHDLPQTLHMKKIAHILEIFGKIIHEVSPSTPSPGRLLGLLMAAWIGSALLLWMCAATAALLLENKWIAAMDSRILESVRHFKSPAVTKFMTAVSMSGGAVFLTSCGILLGIYLFRARKIPDLIGFAFTMIGGSFLFLLLNVHIRRPRPVSEFHFVKSSGWSFPSGHAMTAVLFYGMATYLICNHVHTWSLKVLAAAMAGIIVVLIGLSRIYFQVHYLTDILAGYAFGLFWLFVCIICVEAYKALVKVH